MSGICFIGRKCCALLSRLLARVEYFLLDYVVAPLSYLRRRLLARLHLWLESDDELDTPI